MASDTKSKAELIDERKANLPLPEDPPVASDFNSADERTVNVGTGRVQDDISHGKGDESGLRGPQPAGSNVTTGGVDSGVGRAGEGTADDVPKQ